MVAKLRAAEDRSHNQVFTSTCSLEGLRDQLPLRWPTPPDTPPSPKLKYRSKYVYQGWEDLNAMASWEHLTDVDWLLRLVDFDGLRPVLAQQLGWTSARGQVPFDPVSIFLLIGWQITSQWPRTTVLKKIADPRYADYARRFGFRDGLFPTEGALRYFLTTLGANSETNGQTVVLTDHSYIIQALNQPLIQSVDLFRQAGLLSPETWDEALICPDGMLHPAASRMRCIGVTETCHQPIRPGQGRPCPAREKEREGCACDSPACASCCQYAPARDPQARYVWYEGSNRSDPNPNRSTNKTHKSKRGKAVFGYRSLPLQLADTERRFSLILLDEVQPANRTEEFPAAAELSYLPTAYPSLRVDAVAGDAGFGFDLPLSVIYHQLHARRLVDVRAHKTDRDKSLWLIRGYDDKGRPLCPFGYPLIANGFDPERQRYKWLCNHSCLHGKLPVVSPPELALPPRDCPFLDQAQFPHGRVINIGERFKDGSIRLVRDAPLGSSSWKALYHRARNAVEGRNAKFAEWRLKRMPVFGLPRVRAFIFMTDILINLSTLARLIAEASLANRPP